MPSLIQLARVLQGTGSGSICMGHGCLGRALDTAERVPKGRGAGGWHQEESGAKADVQKQTTEDNSQQPKCPLDKEDVVHICRGILLGHKK